MKKGILYLVVLAGGFACTKTPTACMNLSTTSANVGDTVRMTSCSENAEYHDWKIDDISLSSIAGTLGLDYTLVLTAENPTCATYVDVVFNEPGTYNMYLVVPKLKSGTCSSTAISWRKDFEDSAVLIVN